MRATITIDTPDVAPDEAKKIIDQIRFMPILPTGTMIEATDSDSGKALGLIWEVGRGPR